MGPGEFWPDLGRAPMTEQEIERSLVPADLFIAAYDRLTAQCVYVSSQAQKWLDDHAPALPFNYVRMRGKPQVRVIPVAGRRVGIICFAPGNENAREEAIKAGRELRGAVDLLVGVSPWGADAEREFAARADGLYHILLGGGPGYGFGSAVSGPSRGVLWARSETEGRAVTIIELLAWPDPAMHMWENHANFTSQVKSLGPDVPSDQEIMRIFPAKN